ncbi:unnamed protein product [Cochlearia groenlandica]
MRAKLGYIVAKEFWGQGIATEAVRIAVEQAFEVFPALVRIEAMVIVENKASHKVLEKVGFVKEETKFVVSMLLKPTRSILSRLPLVVKSLSTDNGSIASERDFETEIFGFMLRSSRSERFFEEEKEDES